MLTKKKDWNETLNGKLINVKLNNKSIRTLLDKGSDTWKVIEEPHLDLTRKVARIIYGN